MEKKSSNVWYTFWSEQQLPPKFDMEEALDGLSIYS